MFVTPKFDRINKMKLESENKRSNRSLNFAKIYFHNKDYQTSEKYVMEHLEKNPNSPQAYKLLAQIDEVNGNTERAIINYKKSLEISKNLQLSSPTDFNVSIQSPAKNHPSPVQNLNKSFENSPPTRSINIQYDNLLQKVLSQQETLKELLLKNSENIKSIKNQIDFGFNSLSSQIDSLNLNQNELKESFYDYISQYQDNQENQLTSSNLENVSFSTLMQSNEEGWRYQNDMNQPFTFEKPVPLISNPEAIQFSFNQSHEQSNSSAAFNQTSTSISSQSNSFKFSPNIQANQVAVNANNSTKPLSELFKKPENSWECQECYVLNQLESQTCISCGTPNPSFVGNKSQDQDQGLPKQPTFNFGFGTYLTASSTNQSNTNVFNSEFKFGNVESNSNNILLQNVFGTNNISNAPKEPTFNFTMPQNFNFQFSVKDDKNLQSTPDNQTKTNQSLNTTKSPEKDHSFTHDLHNETPEASNADNIYFQPIIPLPPKVDVKTGEEDEKTLLCLRAKLFRFHNSEWKERGIGEVKILFNTKTGIKRVLMRRDTVLKVCLNHRITSDIKLEEKPDKKSFSWTAVDCSEDKPNAELFAIRFKTPEIASEFFNAFKEAQGSLQGTTQDTSQDKSQGPHQVTNNDTTENYDEIQVIYEKKPQSKEILEKVQLLKLPLNFFDYENLPDCPGCRGCIEKTETKAINPNIQNEQVDENQIKKENSLFSSLIENTNITKTDWNTSTKPSWIHNTPAPIFSNEKHEENEEEHDIYFKPIVPLPNVVEVKTGEEDEIPIFCQRAKLFRFDGKIKEWKEKGIGEFKILKHKNKCRYRLLLRREQILKIACNHYITPTINLTPLNTSETSVMWFANDYSEDKPTYEQFAIKFKNKELLKEFVTVFERCQKEIVDIAENNKESNAFDNYRNADQQDVYNEDENHDGDNDEDDEDEDEYETENSD